MPHREYVTSSKFCHCYLYKLMEDRNKNRVSVGLVTTLVSCRVYHLRSCVITDIFRFYQYIFHRNQEKWVDIHAFYTRDTFISNAMLKLAKNQANAKQHPEIELLLFKKYPHPSSTVSSKNDRTYSKQ